MQSDVAQSPDINSAPQLQQGHAGVDVMSAVFVLYTTTQLQEHL